MDQVPLFVGFPHQEYWSGLIFSPPGNLPEPGIKPESPVSLALAGRFFTTEPLGKFLLPDFDGSLKLLESSGSKYQNYLKEES